MQMSTVASILPTSSSAKHGKNRQRAQTFRSGEERAGPAFMGSGALPPPTTSEILEFGNRTQDQVHLLGFPNRGR